MARAGVVFAAVPTEGVRKVREAEDKSEDIIDEASDEADRIIADAETEASRRIRLGL